jgi:hypothetical protein
MIHSRWTSARAVKREEEIIMRFAYLTLDEVNQDLAQAIAAEHAVDLEVHARHDAIKGREYDAVCCDLDSFPAEEREAYLMALAEDLKNQPIALHSYNLGGRQLRLLHRIGLLSTKSLRSELFGRLLAAIQRKRSKQTVA